MENPSFASIGLFCVLGYIINVLLKYSIYEGCEASDFLWFRRSCQKDVDTKGMESTGQRLESN